MGCYKDSLVSIIVPVHNAVEFLERSIKNILKQTYNNIEIIIINNGSDDGTQEICEELLKIHKKIKLVNTSRKGVSNARNIGIESAKGDIVAFCDADDYFEDRIIEKAVFEITQNNIDICVFGINVVDNYGRLVEKKLIDKEEVWNSEKLIINALVDKRVMGSVWNKVFRKSIIDNVYFDTDLSMCEDCHFLINVATKHRTNRIKYCNYIGYNYVINPDSVTNNISKVFDHNENRYIQALEQIKKDCELNKFEKRYLNIACAALAFEGNSLLNNNKTFEKEYYYNRKNHLRKFIKRYFHIYFFCNKIPLKNKIRTLTNFIMKR